MPFPVKRTLFWFVYIFSWLFLPIWISYMFSWTFLPTEIAQLVGYPNPEKAVALCNMIAGWSLFLRLFVSHMLDDHWLSRRHCRHCAKPGHNRFVLLKSETYQDRDEQWHTFKTWTCLHCGEADSYSEDWYSKEKKHWYLLWGASVIRGTFLNIDKSVFQVY